MRWRLKRLLQEIKSSKFAIAAMVLLIAYIAFKVASAWVTQPVSSDGYIRDGETVDYETEQILTERSLAEAAEYEKAEMHQQMMKTLFFCLNTAQDNNNYDCIANIMSEKIQKQFVQGDMNIGRNIYDYILQDRVLTGIEPIAQSGNYKKAVYTVWFKFLDGTQDNYLVELEENKITKFEGRE